MQEKNFKDVILCCIYMANTNNFTYNKKFYLC